MIEQWEIAVILLCLLGQTRTYQGIRFTCHALDNAGKIKYAKGLIAALPDPERYVLEMAFERTRSTIAADRMATHPATEVMQ